MPTWGWIVIGVAAGLGLLWLQATIWGVCILAARADKAREKAWQEYLQRLEEDPLQEPDWSARL